MIELEGIVNPRVSVLIPVYNCERYIGAALDSIRAQTFRDLEIIVVDDGSEDQTPDIVSKYADVRLIRCMHRGVSAARNAAISCARGEFIAFLDADDLWSSDKLEKQVAYMDSHPECALVFSGRRNFFEGDPKRMTKRQTDLMRNTQEYCLVTACIRKTVFERYGLFREDLRYGEDTEWKMRIGLAGIKLDEIVPDELYLRRVHGGNISLAHEKAERDDVLSLLASVIRSAGKKI